MKHTKGPWKIIHEFNVISDTGRVIAACGGHSDNRNIEGTHNENIANTRLISAAPDMYEALKDLIESYDILIESVLPANSIAAGSVKGTFLYIDKAKQALKKAEGKEG